MPSYLNGLEILAGNPRLAKKWGRCGLLCNQASITSKFENSWDVLAKILKKDLVALFGPQQGFYGTLQYNMEETSHALHDHLQIPIYSLYSETREPTADMLRNLDTIIFDLQITGCRIYTFKQSLAACLRAGKKYGKKVVVLDRPNPLGGEILEGRILDSDCKSFVGEFPFSMRHGMTPGEVAQYANRDIGCELEVIRLKNWNPKFYWTDYERPWIILTAAVPNIDSIYIYPGTVLLEGTNLSEGRGTTLPFQFIGAPYIKNSRAWIKRIQELLKKKTPGVFLREAAFQPTFNKWQGKHCNGLQIHVTDCKKVRSYPLVLAIIHAAWEMADGAFEWQQPPYEYVHDKLPLQLLAGSMKAPEKLQDGFSLKDPFWREGVKEYAREAREFLLYKRKFVIPSIWSRRSWKGFFLE